MAATKEPQYQSSVELAKRIGLQTFGLMSNETWYEDPKRLTFVLSRYKFASRMLKGRKNVLEIGCADAFATRIVQQEVGSVTAVDFDEVFIADVKARMSEQWRLDIFQHDLLAGPVPENSKGKYDAAYALDVLEHIPPERELLFMQNICASLTEDGIVLLGLPSIHSQVYASPRSKAGHVNCKDEPGLRALAEKFFHSYFVFSMNDEVVHTGYSMMAHYFFLLCCHRRR